MSNGAQESVWDGGASQWDVDVAGPGTRSMWDLLPEFLAIDELARVEPAKWVAKVEP